LLKDRRCQPALAHLTSKTVTKPGIGPRVAAQEEDRMKELTKIIVGGASTVALAGGIGAGLAYADTPSDEPTASPSVTPASSPPETPSAKSSGKRDQNGDRRQFARIAGTCWHAHYMARSPLRARSIG
jgi:hypothetical protein